MTEIFRSAATARMMLAVALVAGPTTACASGQAAGYDQAHQPTETAAMPSATTTVEGNDVRLEVAFDSSAGGSLRVRYRVHNTGSVDLAVFDRGNRHAVLTRRQPVGEVGDPTFHEEVGGLTLSHRALPLPDPSPTLPPVPLAARLAPGEVLEGGFSFAPLAGDQPDRTRWCLGVAAFDEQLLRSPEQGAGVEVWQASFTLADSQQLVCTPWFDTGRGVFLD